MRLIFKIVPEQEWRQAQHAGVFTGSQVDVADGFIHFSTAEQVAETSARHFAGQDGLMLVAVNADALGPALRREPSRGGDLFPHLYGPLHLDAVVWARPLPLAADGRHRFPPLGPDGQGPEPRT